MQVFVPFQSPFAVAMCLDTRRLNKQIIECQQILNAIDGKTTAWSNHPAVKMYRRYREWLYNYALCLQEYRNYEKYHTDVFSRIVSRNNSIKYSWRANKIRPPFLVKEFCNQHRRRLYTKSPDFYAQFAKYGESEENWYYVNGEILRYVNGKRIK